MPVPELAHFVQSVTHAIWSPGIESERKNISMQPADLNFSIAKMTAGKGEKKWGIQRDRPVYQKALTWRTSARCL
jgi:hypothetical protein